MAKKLQHMYHVCRITVKFNGVFVFANFREIFAKRNFAKIVPFSHDFRIFANIEKCIFVSTLGDTHGFFIVPSLHIGRYTVVGLDMQFLCINLVKLTAYLTFQDTDAQY
jgi:hypothetical protein